MQYIARFMQGQKKIVIVGNDQERCQQFEMILSFVGEQFVSCTQAELASVFTQTEHILAVVLIEHIDQQIIDFVKSQPKCPFVFHDVLDPKDLNDCVNILGN